jgi:hypothetical protein
MGWIDIPRHPAVRSSNGNWNAKHPLGARMPALNLTRNSAAITSVLTLASFYSLSPAPH